MTLFKPQSSKDQDVPQPVPASNWAKAAQYLLAFLSFLAFSGAAVWILLRLRANFIQIVTFFNISKRAYLGATNLGTFILMLLVLIGVAWMQNYLFKGVPQGLLWKRAGKILLAEVILTAISMIFTAIMWFLVL
jgi:hypothetical protein